MGKEGNKEAYSGKRLEGRYKDYIEGERDGIKRRRGMTEQNG